MTDTAPVVKVKMTHREILTALTGILMGMFVSILANTVVSSSLPVIVSDLHGSQTSYTWVVTATLLATTISTPIWGKLADLGNRKLLLQISLAIFVLASAAAGFSQTTSFLIAMRVIQGLAGGGVGALAQIVMADFLSPRERGKYMGLFGAVMAIGTVGGPLIGGFVTDTINWRWNFFIALPFAIAAVALIQRTLHLPAIAKRKVKIDYWGIVLLSGGVSLLLIWMSLGGSEFEWASTTSLLMVIGAVVLIATFIVVEIKSSEPLLNMSLFKNRTFTFAVIASLAVGVSMFGTSVFLSQYMIMARGASATMAGLMTFPLMGGLLVISTIGGAIISRTGKWKALVVTGSVLIVIGLFLLGTIHYDTNYAVVASFMFILGAGMGLVMQNMVLVVQNSVDIKQLGVASSSVNFFRTLGGTAGTAGLGAILAATIPDMIADRQADLMQAIGSLGEKGQAIAQMLSSGNLPTVSTLPEPVRVIFESIYGDAVPSLFAFAAPLSLLVVIAVCLIPNQSLTTQNASERLQEVEAETTLNSAGVTADAKSIETEPMKVEANSTASPTAQKSADN